MSVLRVAVSGASGMIGTALVSKLSEDGHRVERLVRKSSESGGEIVWDPESGTIDPAPLDGLDAIVHLAGENIGGGRWTEERKRKILESRVNGTGALARAIEARKGTPPVFVSVSAVGYYGPDDPVVDESGPKGEGFLADVSAAWEEAAAPAARAGARVVHPRFGVVLSERGGVLERMLTPFKLGVGGKLGSGEQWMSWITLEDVVRVLVMAITDGRMQGPINTVAPNPVTNAQFSKMLGHALHRPSALPAPTFALKALLGSEMAEELLLGGQRVTPKRLEALGFEWKWPTLEPALEHMLR